MACFQYGSLEINYLKRKDKKLGDVIDRVGIQQRQVIPDLFAAVVNSIVGQQISPKAADTIWNRMLSKLGDITADNLAALPPDTVQSCGLSYRKVGYIQSIAQKIQQNELDLSSIASLSNEEVVKTLSGLPGIGVWTAEMLMIFSLQRPDVVSFGDAAIRRGMMKVYGLDSLSKETFLKIRQRYSPYGTVASFYLWAAAHKK